MNDLSPKPVLTVSVRDLVEFVLRRGDLGGERRFVKSDRALVGIRGHQKIQRSRPAGYQTETSVEHRVEAEEFTLHIRGRIDGVLAAPDELLLEEIKTVEGPWDQQGDALHWAQLKVYGFMFAYERSVSELILQLTYLELEGGKITEFRQTCAFAELSEFASSTIAVYLDWLKERHRWNLKRNHSILALSFPFGAYRPGQRELAVAAYRVMASGGRLFLSAPTGIGKTMSVLFPGIKALGEGKLKRIFYLTARTVGRAVAEKALTELRQRGLKLSSVTLTAKDKVCVRDGHPCDSSTCPLALGYYDRVKPAMREALGRGEINRTALDEVAQKHQVCPFELSLDVSVWADVVIGDYNYVFDPTAYLRRHFEEEGGDYAFLVDEAHNLVDRARDMYSADLDSSEITAARRALKTALPRVSRALAKLKSAISKLAASTAKDEIEASDLAFELNLFPAALVTPTNENSDTRAVHNYPETLTEPLDDALTETEAWLAQNKATEFRDELLALYFRMHSFKRTAENYDENFVTIIKSGSSSNVRLFCLNPSDLVRQALARGKSAVFFSATLTPIEYYRSLLGGAPEDSVLQFPSPFPPENLAVLIQDRIPTQFKSRTGSLPDVVDAIGELVQARRGNYLVYFPSYQYLNAARQEFQGRYATVSLLVQQPNMTERERDEFLFAFHEDHDETLLGFAVLGGLFGEGIDLVGERLIGVIVVGVGLPQLSIERDLIRDYFREHETSGFDYAYTFPGMNRVLQAVGRVIRSESDRGVVLLVDSRYGELRYRRLFPAWWKFTCVRNKGSLQAAATEFWVR